MMADGPGRTVVILRDRPAPPMTYAVDHFAARWRAAGHRVLDHIGPTGIPDADVVVVHIDLTVVPPEYVDAIGALSGVVVNGEVLDISRRRFSRLLVSRDDDYAGPVIVKTNANYGGRPEWEATDPAAPPPIPADKFARPKGMRPKGLRSFLRRSRLGQTANRIRRRETVRGWDAIETLSPENYPIFEGIDSVPAGVWENDHLVAERFIGHPEGGLFYTHYCSFFGDREIAGRLGSPDPIVKFYNAASDVELPVPDAVRRWRDELRIDAGRFDYLEADGEYYLIDVNKTEGGGSINDKFPAEMDFLAAGLDSFLSPPGSPGESA